MPFLTYLIGFVILIAGLAWGATMLGVPGTYIAVGAVILAGLALMSAVTRTRGVASDGTATSGKTDVTIVK